MEQDWQRLMSNVAAGKELDFPEVLAWLTLKFADWLEIAPDELDSHRAISSYGLDSISAVTLSVQLEEELGIELDTAVLWNHPTDENKRSRAGEAINRKGSFSGGMWRIGSPLPSICS